MMSSTEIEIKLPVVRLTDVRAKLDDIGALLVTPRTLERNWRFDTPDGELTRTGRVLRVRSAQAATMTYKQRTGKRLTRREIEIDISSADRATELLKGLGYEVILVYEKYREVFKVEDTEIMLDEIPFGCFVEIEGPDEAALRQAADRLGLAWAAGIDISYLQLFEQLKKRGRLNAANMTFAEFENIPSNSITLLGLRDALSGHQIQG